MKAYNRREKMARYVAPTTVFESQTDEDFEVGAARKRHPNSRVILDKGTTFTVKMKKGKKIIKCKKGTESKLLVPKGPDRSLAKAKTEYELEKAKKDSRFERARMIWAQLRKSDSEEKAVNGHLAYIPKGKDGRLKKFRVWTRNPPKIKEKQPKKNEKEQWQIEYLEMRKFKNMLNIAMGMLKMEGASSKEELAFMEEHFKKYDRAERKEFVANVQKAMEEDTVKAITYK